MNSGLKRTNAFRNLLKYSTSSSSFTCFNFDYEDLAAQLNSQAHAAFYTQTRSFVECEIENISLYLNNIIKLTRLWWTVLSAHRQSTPFIHLPNLIKNTFFNKHEIYICFFFLFASKGLLPLQTPSESRDAQFNYNKKEMYTFAQAPEKSFFRSGLFERSPCKPQLENKSGL